MNRLMESSNRSSTALPTASGPPGLYLVVSAGLATFNQVQDKAARLVRIAELAYGQRDLIKTERAGRELASLPFEQAQSAGLYYLAIVTKWQGRTSQAQAMLEAVRGQYQARAIQALGAIHFEAGRFDEAARMHMETMRAGQGRDALAVIGAQFQLSAIKSIEGDHDRAIDDLHALWPAVRVAAKSHPHLWPTFHNEIAFELLQLGRVAEAQQAARIATASPIARHYRDWQETAREIAETQRTAIIVVVPARASEQKPQRKAPIIRYHFVGPRLRHRIIKSVTKPAGVRAPVICSMIERVRTCAPVHGPPSRSSTGQTDKPSNEDRGRRLHSLPLAQYRLGPASTNTKRGA